MTPLHALALAVALTSGQLATVGGVQAPTPHRAAQGLTARVTRALARTVPHLSPPTRASYARAMVAASREVDIGVGWIAARTYVESGFHNIVSERFRGPGYWRQSWGVMQLEVTPRTLPRYRGREHLLMAPALNFRLGAKFLGYWKRWHARGRCKQSPNHPFWLHYKYGYVIPQKRRHMPRGGWKMERFRRRFLRTMMMRGI